MIIFCSINKKGAGLISFSLRVLLHQSAFIGCFFFFLLIFSYLIKHFFYNLIVYFLAQNIKLGTTKKKLIEYLVSFLVSLLNFAFHHLFTASAFFQLSICCRWYTFVLYKQVVSGSWFRNWQFGWEDFSTTRKQGLLCEL